MAVAIKAAYRAGLGDWTEAGQVGAGQRGTGAEAGRGWHRTSDACYRCCWMLTAFFISLPHAAPRSLPQGLQHQFLWPGAASPIRPLQVPEGSWLCTTESREVVRLRRRRAIYKCGTRRPLAPCAGAARRFLCDKELLPAGHTLAPVAASDDMLADIHCPKYIKSVRCADWRASPESGVQAAMMFCLRWGACPQAPHTVVCCIQGVLSFLSS